MALKTLKKPRMLAALLPLLLAACSALPHPGGDAAEDAGGGLLGGLTASLPTAPTHVVVSESPAEVYTRLARQIYACWLAAEPPLLPGQQFYAEAEPGDGGNARISLHVPGSEAQKGLRTYAISMRRADGGTHIETEPLRIEDPAQRQAMHAAVMAWAQGEPACTPAGVPVVTAGAGEGMDAAAGPQPDAPPLPQRKPKNRAVPRQPIEPAPAQTKAARKAEAAQKGAPAAGPDAAPAAANEPAAAAPSEATPQPQPQPAEAALPAQHKFLQTEPGFAGR